jgi:hypothetical protein
MKHRQGELLSEEGHSSIMTKAVEGFVHIRNTAYQELTRRGVARVIKALIVVGSIGAGTADKNPPKTDSDFDGRLVVNGDFDRVTFNLFASTFLHSFSDYMAPDIEVDSCLFPIPNTYEAIRWSLSDPIPWHHQGVSLICEPDDELISTVQRVAEVNRLKLSVYSTK